MAKKSSAKTALLIIDMQNDFVQKGSFLEVTGIRKNISAYSKFIKKMRDSGITGIYTRHCFDPLKNPVELKLFPKTKEKGLRKGTDGWQICNELEPESDDVIVDKTRYDAFFKTNLLKILKKHDIKNIIITGTMTNICCESTARTAMYLDYNVIFCSDLTFCSDKQIQKCTQKTIASNFGIVLSSKQILRAYCREF